jgi:filamentous hemagglutinin
VAEAWRRRRINKSQFSISKDELAMLLQSEGVVRVPAVRVASGNFVREVDVRREIGHFPAKRGGAPTSILTVITDGSGNLVNTFPGKLNY